MGKKMNILNKYSKQLTYIVLGLQVLGMVLAIEIGGWFTLLYIGINLAWGVWWCYKNFALIDTVSDYILGQAKGKPYYKGQPIKEKKKKKSTQR